MKNAKRSWWNILGVAIILAAVVTMFQWYSKTNRSRIETQNLNYAMDSARQTVSRIEGEFQGAVRRLLTYTYIVNTALDDSEITPDMLKNMEDFSVFDSFYYINADGLNMASDGQTIDVSDRDYFKKGMSGESGNRIVHDFRFNDDTMMVFYAPLKQNNEVVGLLAGVYRADDYLRELIETSYFGEAADVFLCCIDGTVISNTGGGDYELPLPDVLLDKGVIDVKSADEMWEVFNNKEGEKALFCNSKNRTTDNICVKYIPNTDCVLVQTFPLSVTQSMIGSANRTGMILQISLIVLFAVYILLLVFRAGHERKRLEKENTEMGYVTSGTNALFNRFILADLEKGTYRFLLETAPNDRNFPLSGKYEDFVAYRCSNMADEEDRENFPLYFAKETIIAELDAGVSDIQYE
ncbi:MAG: cache domain-containing protein, partial [Oscillospiraceae bacterium]|nr:cache domain-containing protein [Oscillospiraceae bacterium]